MKLKYIIYRDNNGVKKKRSINKKQLKKGGVLDDEKIDALNNAYTITDINRELKDAIYDNIIKSLGANFDNKSTDMLRKLLENYERVKNTLTQLLDKHKRLFKLNMKEKNDILCQTFKNNLNIIEKTDRELEDIIFKENTIFKESQISYDESHKFIIDKINTLISDYEIILEESDKNLLIARIISYIDLNDDIDIENNDNILRLLLMFRIIIGLEVYSLDNIHIEKLTELFKECLLGSNKIKVKKEEYNFIFKQQIINILISILTMVKDNLTCNLLRLFIKNIKNIKKLNNNIDEFINNQLYLDRYNKLKIILEQMIIIDDEDEIKKLISKLPNFNSMTDDEIRDEINKYITEERHKAIIKRGIKRQIQHYIDSYQIPDDIKDLLFEKIEHIIHRINHKKLEDIFKLFIYGVIIAFANKEQDSFKRHIKNMLYESLFIYLTDEELMDNFKFIEKLIKNQEIMKRFIYASRLLIIEKSNYNPEILKNMLLYINRLQYNESNKDKNTLEFVNDLIQYKQKLKMNLSLFQSLEQDLKSKSPLTPEDILVTPINIIRNINKLYITLEFKEKILSELMRMYKEGNIKTEKDMLNNILLEYLKISLQLTNDKRMDELKQLFIDYKDGITQEKYDKFVTKFQYTQLLYEPYDRIYTIVEKLLKK